MRNAVTIKWSPLARTEKIRVKLVSGISNSSDPEKRGKPYSYYQTVRQSNDLEVFKGIPSSFNAEALVARRTTENIIEAAYYDNFGNKIILLPKTINTEEE
ncbi:MAG: hypothetical protein NVS1B13_25600 [Flavisolibacter sp.]